MKNSRRADTQSCGNSTPSCHDAVDGWCLLPLYGWGLLCPRKYYCTNDAMIKSFENATASSREIQNQTTDR
eukprot:scaffold2230_cov187-Amphora_coffeaeformis.AAC.15